MHARRTLVSCVAFLLIGGAARPARAFDDELQLGLDLAYAHESADDGDRPGGCLRFRLRYGLSDAFAVVAAAGWAGHAVTTSTTTTALRHVATAEVGAVYAFDVLRAVPYFSLMIGAAFSHQESNDVAFVLDLAGGLDWLWTSRFSVGVEVAYQVLIGEETVPSRFLASLRLNWHFTQ